MNGRGIRQEPKPIHPDCLSLMGQFHDSQNFLQENPDQCIRVSFARRRSDAEAEDKVLLFSRNFQAFVNISRHR